jgi:Zn-dependent protease with chaperone function
MNFSYTLRLLFLSLSSFFLVQTILAIAVNFASPRLIQMAERMKPRTAAWLLFGWRLFPFAFAAFLVLSFCVPSYLWFEPRASREEVDLLCFTLAVLGAATCIWPVVRVAKASANSRHFAETCKTNSETFSMPGESSPLWLVSQEAPLIAVAGIFSQRVLISAPVLRVLSPEELHATLRHERAHRIWHDNLRRLLLLLAPLSFPFFHGLRDLERAWAKFTEWAADDFAAGGDQRIAISLASAIVRVARLGSPSSHPLFLSSLAGGAELSERVERLLNARPSAESSETRLLPRKAFYGGACLALAVALAALYFWPATLLAAHQILERLI